MTEAPLRDLLVETRDGDWGGDVAEPGDLLFTVIRGADFPAVREGDHSGVPRRYLKSGSAARRTLKPSDIVIETAGGNRDRPTGRTLFITKRVLDAIDGPVEDVPLAVEVRGGGPGVTVRQQ